jgi:glutamate-5-semialdehyde dehydrogenase
MDAELKQLGQQAKAAARVLLKSGTRQKNQALHFMAEAIMANGAAIYEANARDLDTGRDMGLSEALLERLTLNPKRLKEICDGINAVADLPDPVGEDFESRVLENGLRLSKRRIPIGVIGVIYESRPNVTADIAALCLKSGNAAILRGGKEAIHSNRALAQAVVTGCVEAGLPAHTVQLIQSTDRALVKDLLRANAYVDMIIPRGGAALHQFAIDNATIPVITGGIGVCHVYIEASADPAKIVPIIVNAKVQRPSVCNAIDTILVDRSIAPAILPKVAEALIEHEVELRCEPQAYAILKGKPDVVEAGPDDFDTEFMALIAAVKVVGGLDEALDHIFAHSTRHSEAIITEDYRAATRFVDELDSAAVFVNASTRFNDGGQFGLGAEVAVSTQRLHARGPMGLKELTTYKWVVFGDGQVRP